MAGKPGGGVSAFSWTLLGFLAGVAATLAVQMIGGHGDDADEDAPASSAAVLSAKLPAPTTLHHHSRSGDRETADAATAAAQGAPEAAHQATAATDDPGAPDATATAAAPAKPKPKPKAAPADAQVYDDAAAAGMTSRASPPPNP
jgi:hypothetical protein